MSRQKRTFLRIGEGVFLFAKRFRDDRTTPFLEKLEMVLISSDKISIIRKMIFSIKGCKNPNPKLREQRL